MGRFRHSYFKLYLGKEGVDVEEILGQKIISAKLSEERKETSELTVSFDGLLNPKLLDHRLLKTDGRARWEFGFIGDRWSGLGGRVRTDTFIFKNRKNKYEDGHAALDLVCMDASVKLRSHLSTRTFVNMTASEIAMEMARVVGINADVEETEIVYPYVPCNGKNFGKVLQKLANQEDLEFWAKGSTLYLRRGTNSPTSVIPLEYSALGPGRDRGLYLVDFSTDSEGVGRQGGKRRRAAGTDKDGKSESSAQDGNTATGIHFQSGSGHTYDSVGASNVYMPVHTPVKDEKRKARYNATQAKFIKWRGESAEGTIYGGFIKTRDWFGVTNVAEMDQGPWYVDSVQTNFDDGLIHCKFEAITEPENRKKGGGKKKTTDENNSSARPGEFAVGFEFHSGSGNTEVVVPKNASHTMIKRTRVKVNPSLVPEGGQIVDRFR